LGSPLYVLIRTTKICATKKKMHVVYCSYTFIHSAQSRMKGKKELIGLLFF
jgi:hypothetical protein